MTAPSQARLQQESRAAHADNQVDARAVRPYSEVEDAEGRMV